MKQLWKRNAVVGTIVVFVCAAIFLNGKYAEKVEKPTKILGQSELVSTDGGAAEVSADAEGKDYFASARLTRQQARDSALSLLKEASESEEVDAETANEAAKSIETLASYTLCEAQIENIVTAKGYEDCPEGGARCMRCYRQRLEKTAALAKEMGFDYFCTTLSISPLKDAQKINAIGQSVGEQYGVAWLPSDFKKQERYKRSIALSREYGLYRQNFCGCVYSKQEKEKPV